MPSAQIELSAPEPGLAVVTLSHPGKFNAMSRSMWQALRTLFLHLQAQPELRVVLLRGADGHFCAGGDISEYSSFRFDPASLRAFHEEEVWGALAAMLACDLPIVAQIDGNCMGAGVEIASCCDIRIAAADARFGAPIAKLGFPMAPREAQLVAGAVGDVTARQLLLEAASFGAPEMLARGFLSRVVAPEQLPAQAQESVRRIAVLAPGAARLNKQTLRALKMPSAHTNQAHIAIKNIVNGSPDPYAYADSAEHREGIAAFMAKRPPVF